jgi:hypothetical protein
LSCHYEIHRQLDPPGVVPSSHCPDFRETKPSLDYSWIDKRYDDFTIAKALPVALL